ncbi:MAG TPA: hypothetical protein PLD69_05525, partial [Sphaerochaeta sp.]|nr:hypothetical protein [Sphaerochaeta sp.]
LPKGVTRAFLISGCKSRGAFTEQIHAQAPLSELFGYSTVLRSATQGRGTFSLEFDHYQEKGV